jgi:elongation of very long chain fatty acids protein 4
VKLIVRYLERLQIIMVLKRNTRQITFLHVYHHSSIALIWWIIAYHAPGGEGRTDCCNGSTLCRQVVNDILTDLISKLWIFAAYFSAALNSGVHVFMYLYYFLAAVLRGNEKVRRKYLFWGR